MNLEIREAHSIREFIEVNVKINSGNIDYIRPLDKDIFDTFDSKKNKFLKQGKYKLFVLERGKNHLIGRIAAFINPRYKNKGDQCKVGCFGFFDCEDNQEAANLLFDSAKIWLEKEGKEAMDGPINFGERDRFWGLLISGFHEPPYGLNYNPPYYKKLFENYGLQIFYNQLCYNITLGKGKSQLQEKFYKAHQKFDNNPDFKAIHIEKNQIEKFARDFSTVYNQAWASHQGNKKMSFEQAKLLFGRMKSVMDHRIIWFVYCKNEPVAMWLNLPELNQIFKKFNGSLNLFNKLRFLWLKKRRGFTKMMGLVYGVVPEFQGKGVDFYMLVTAEKFLKEKTKYEQIEIQWQGDFNPKMLNTTKHIGADLTRTLATYRFLFDSTKKFERHPIL